MTDSSTRWPCPVCLGVTMEKVAVGGDRPVTLDHCPRCGGIWFELGEVQLLRSRAAEALWTAVARRGEPMRAQCHSCHAHVDRDAESCPACGHALLLHCPPCQHPMERGSEAGVTLDVCRECRGVWFDHHELSAIWNQQLGNALARRDGAARDDASSVLAGSLLYAPDLVFFGAHAAAHAVAASAHGLAHAPEAIAGAAEVAGEAAASVFETIMEIIGELFG